MVNTTKESLSSTREPRPLHHYLVRDAAAAATAAAAITPILTAADRSVVEHVSTGRPLLRALAKNLLCPFTHPRRFFATKPAFVLWTLYASTYMTANATQTVLDRSFEVDKVLTSTLISSAVFLVNTPLSLWKDVRFAQYFSGPLKVENNKLGPVVSPLATASRKLPVSVTGAFLVRDIITVFGSLAIAPHVSAVIPDGLVRSQQAKASVAQLIVPAMTQIFATPFHLVALDIYNRPHVSSMKDRVNKMREKMPSTTAMRAVRLVPAFGIGIICNTRLRAHLSGDGNKEDGTAVYDDEFHATTTA
ncbi:membrane protein [Paramyrothecium foliicola]|nr:membrane protein [Paramyrothecium foliicola]